VVEHSIGNGEVDSSILSGSTSFSLDPLCNISMIAGLRLIVGFGCFKRSQTQQDINRLPA
jgi:hypothetical protein